MYHKVDPAHTDMLTVTPEQLRQQLQYLHTNGYSVITMPDLLAYARDQRSSLPKRPVLITFDDAYANNLTYALPILKEHPTPATIFVPTAYVGDVNAWDRDAPSFVADNLLTAEQLKGLTSSLISLAYHSHRHINYKHTDVDGIRNDLTENKQAAQEMALPMVSAFAYPYGGRPKKPAARQQMQDAMQAAGIQLGFRIGNRINPLPIRNLFDINRIDIRGTDSFSAFKRKIRWGKLL
ncbi:hypothetical protein BLX24_24415 [Arsenicibacter rosenii]|uniref:NodB homology domain-containing protein n=2 Tax=Arsenicibacter rosenii TaxID=1750698 RepID=A0A1S2VCH4_9BACT|nr:hypothetical protein BLX24_24415 [Arsenicibacter rosenii]